MKERNNWIQKKSVVVIIVILLLIAILAVTIKLGMKSGGKPHEVIEKIKNGNKDNDNNQFNSSKSCHYQKSRIK